MSDNNFDNFDSNKLLKHLIDSSDTIVNENALMLLTSATPTTTDDSYQPIGLGLPLTSTRSSSNSNQQQSEEVDLFADYSESSFSVQNLDHLTDKEKEKMKRKELAEKVEKEKAKVIWPTPFKLDKSAGSWVFQYGLGVRSKRNPDIIFCNFKDKDGWCHKNCVAKGMSTSTAIRHILSQHKFDVNKGKTLQ